MVASTHSQMSVGWSERLLITRIITSVGLALLLVIGAWSATHAEQQDSENGAAAPIVALVEMHLGVPDTSTDSIGQTAEGTLMLGAATCILGVLCGLLLVVVNWLLRFLGRATARGSMSPLTRVVRPAPVIPRAATFSIAQLGISRT
jgi:hypothetical protein